jgi:hypothetical protein
MQFQIQKVRDEGSSEPFIARLWLGILEIRDQVLQFGSDDPASARNAFDRDYQPVLDALETLRTAAGNIQSLIAEHRQKIESGEAVSFQPNAVAIIESIEVPLRDTVSMFLNAGARVLKGIQPLLDRFQIPIWCLFMKEANFQKGLEDLRAKGHARVADYLSAVRTSWSEQFMERRNALEHKGWRPSPVVYRVDGKRIAMIEPDIDGVPASEYADRMSNRIIGFVEDLLVYAFSMMLPAPVILIEEPAIERDPARPTRFQLSLAGVDRTPWSLQYDDQGFH